MAYFVTCGVCDGKKSLVFLALKTICRYLYVGRTCLLIATRFASQRKHFQHVPKVSGVRVSHWNTLN